MNVYAKQKQTQGDRKQISGYRRGEGMEKSMLGVWD